MGVGGNPSKICRIFEMKRRGLVQVYTGDGKGKTSAAMGAALRAAGQGLRVCVIQFLKSGTPSGEVKALAGLKGKVDVFRFGRKADRGQDFAWVDPDNPRPEDLQEARAALQQAQEALNSRSYDLLVMDEVNLASAWGLVPEEEVLRVIAERPKGVEVILTGRAASKALIDRADLVTEMVCVKHPFDRGAGARRGVDV